MQCYRDFRPTSLDPKGYLLPDQQDWLVAPCGRTRDSGPLERANYDALLEYLGGEGDNVQVHRFGHWGPGWFQIILVRPDSPEAIEAEEIQNALANYPVVNESRLSEYEYEEALQLWHDCFTPAERLQYIRDHYTQFDFADYSELRQCVRGEIFRGYSDELIG